MSGYPQINYNHTHSPSPISDPNQNYTVLPVSNAEHSHLVSGYCPNKYKPNWSSNLNVPGTHQPSPAMGGGGGAQTIQILQELESAL